MLQLRASGTYETRLPSQISRVIWRRRTSSNESRIAEFFGKLIGTTSTGHEAVRDVTEAAKEIPTVTGVYVLGSVNMLDAVYTVDTGASCSIISVKLFNKLPHSHQPQLESTTVKLSGAGGKRLQCMGRGRFDLVIGSLELQTMMIVADITDDILLGADVLLDDITGGLTYYSARGRWLFKGRLFPWSSGLTRYLFERSNLLTPTLYQPAAKQWQTCSSIDERVIRISSGSSNPHTSWRKTTPLPWQPPW